MYLFNTTKLYHSVVCHSRKQIKSQVKDKPDNNLVELSSKFVKMALPLKVEEEGTLYISATGLSSVSEWVSCEEAELQSRPNVLNTKYYTTKVEVKRQRPTEGRRGIM